MELLAPAGSFDALTAAVKNGADAVYFGGSLFNARLGAENFDNEGIVRAIDYCHLHEVKAFITMNTLTHDRDLYPALSFATFLYEHGADAVIIQDMGLFSLIKKHIPDLPLHASTQMCISTLSGVKECERLGFERVVLSRELSLNDIAHIHNNSDMPLEVFVHGAMCMSFSGGCLFSSMVGGRSGNCGSCAQPCRKYAAIDKLPSEKELALSMGDLCMIEHLPKLKKAGAASLKIEGRMKKPEYIAAVTHAYRRALDGAGATEICELKKEMHSVFNRGEFTTGYYFGDGSGCDRITSANPSKELTQKIHERTDNAEKKRKMTLTLTANAGSPARLDVETDGISVSIEGEYVQTAKKEVTAETRSRYASQLEKLGNSVFEAKQIVVNADGFLPVSAINELRRRAVTELEKALSVRNSPISLPESISLPEIPMKKGDVSCSVRVMTAEQAHEAFTSGAHEVVVEYGELSHEEIIALQKYRKIARLLIALPVSLISEDAQKRFKDTVSPKYFDGIEINNIGQKELALSFEHTVGGMQLNVFNAHTARLLLDMGIERLMLSPELNAAQTHEILRFIPSDRLCLHIYGRVVLMNLFHCPIKEHMGCKACKSTWHTLYDADGRRFPIIGMKSNVSCDVVRLYNCYPHDITGLLSDQRFLPKTLSLSFTTESAATVRNRLLELQKEKRSPLPDTTRGYFGK